MTITRPMLAETIEDVSTLKFPVMVSPKLDGIRCLIVGGKALSRKFKPIPNNYVRNWLEANCLDGLDGELMVKGATFNQVQSAIMSEDGEPDFEYHVFDYVVRLDAAFYVRINCLSDWAETNSLDRIKVVYHHKVSTIQELLKYENQYLEEGYEGLMTRDPFGQYKCGRSTLKQGWLLKLKRFADSEAEVLWLEEQKTNTNEKEVNELGLSKRSSKKEGKIGANTLGKFHVRDIHTGQEFDIGTGDGLTQELRREIWENPAKYVGKLVKYKYQPSGGKDLPRFPVWLGMRDPRDL